MHTTLMVVGGISLAAWAYLLLARGGFWRVQRTAPPQFSAESFNIVAVIPARNEADVIARAVASLFSQKIQARLRIVLIDDGSSDGTVDAARRAVEAAGRAADLVVIRGEPLPQGWSGKVWAQYQGVTKAAEYSPDYLLLTDADIEHAPDNVARLIDLAQTNQSDLTSFMVMLHCGSWFERWLIPAFVFFFFMLYPPAWIRDPRRKTAGAAGGCMLIRPQGLAKAGGIEAIRGEIIDDCALARAVKKSGGRVWLGVSESAHSIRPYASVGEIGRMISRSAFNQLHHSTLLLLGTIIGLALIFLAPVALLFMVSVMGVLACAMMLIAYWPMVRFYGLNPLWLVMLPLAAIFYMGATVDSALRYWSGRGGEWKGRVQDHG